MIKIETHCHTFNTSSCADTSDHITINKYLEKGYKGIVSNNHFSAHAYANYMKGSTHEQKVDHFFFCIDEFEKKCNQAGLKAFWGAEIRAKPDIEFSIVGLPREVFYNQPPLFMLTQKQLFDLAEKYGAFMYQTHPFRRGVTTGDPKYMHGAECFNGHYHHQNNNDLAAEFCLKNNLVGLSGTDMHHADQPVTAGIYIPDDVNTTKEYVDYLFKNQFDIIKEEI